MAASESSSSPEVFSWLKSLPVAPEYYPTPAEFQDPIAYIFKIEKEASRFGICKIVPPVPAPARKTVLANLNQSLEARNGGDGGDRSFATRQQQIGFCPRRPRPVQRPVWQSGERYVFAEFEAKAKSFERGFLRKCSKKGGSSSSSAAMEIETMYWKATLDKPFTVEYANDMPGSAFSPSGEGLADSAWNMRTVSRAKGSLLRFMKEEIPGVTSPMVYVAMLFSWFAWHVEDHDLHSLNYLHMGAGKTWYGVPREAAAAFEEVVRVQGYNAEINPLVTFSILGEKTTVMSPDVFVRAGVPCCRLVQNAGEFVVTFPRAYHTGFSHGFNCAEAANIATPEWLALAKDAAIRRASINYPPMVSHFQLLYDLALELCSRIPLGINTEPRSSRLKDKKKGEGETVVKEIFVQNVIENNDLLHALGKGSPIVLLPKIYSDSPVYPEFRVGLQSRFNYRVPLASCNSREEKASSKGLISDDTMLDRKQDEDKVEGFYSMKGKLASLCEGSWVPSFRGNKLTPASNHNAPNTTSGTEYSSETNGLSNNRLFSCVTCGILSFACVALIKPKEPAARYLMSADCSIFNDWAVNPGVANRVFSASNVDHTASKQNTTGGWTGTSAPPHDIPVVSTSYGVQTKDQTNDLVSNSVTNKCSSALGLLALNYGNSSDSDEDPVQEDQTVDDRETSGANCFSERTSQCTSSSSTFLKNDIRTGNGCDRDNISHQSNGCDNKSEDNDVVRKGSDSLLASRTCSPDTYDAEATKFCKAMTPKTNGNMPLTQVCDHDSSRLHVFCLEHALEVEQQLCEIGGVHIQLLCHPDYSKIETEAKAMAEELGLSHVWNDITVREATKDDEETIQSALDSEEGMPKNGDWAVKLGINLFYSANLSRSPLYSKQMPYNSVIYNAFGRSSPGNLSARPSGLNRKSSRQRKFLVGKWCGKVWMSNQVHPLLVERDSETEGGEETGRGFNGREPNVKPMRKSDVARRNLEYSTSSITKKYTRKRKLGGVGHDTKKGKRVKREDDEILDHSPDVDSHEHHRTRSLTSKNAFRNGARSAKKSKHVELEDEPSDDSMGNAGSSRKQNKSAIRRKKPAHIDTGEGVSDNSLVSFGRLHEQILRRKRANHRLRRDDLDSEDSLDCDSHRVRVTVPSNNQAKPSEHESVEDSDDSADTDSHLPARKISKGKLARFTEREDSTSDDFQENHPRKRYTKNKKKKTTKRKPAKPVEMEEEEEQEEEDVDESVVNMRTRRSKLTKSTRKKTKQEPRNPKQNTPSSGEEDPVEEPRTRLRKRAVKPQKKSTPSLAVKRRSKPTDDLSGAAIGAEEGEHGCDVEGCTMSFGTRQELVLHKRNICPIKGCGKKFFSHKYLVQHRRVHVDDRPLRCPWKGCKMTFKWPWARTEHIRVHTGARPYICAEPGCGQTFRFVSDFSRHKRKTGHSVKKGR